MKRNSAIAALCAFAIALTLGAGLAFFGRAAPTSNEGTTRERQDSPAVHEIDGSAVTKTAWVELQINGREIEYYNSLDKMTDSATAVVVGAIDSAEPGRTYSLENAQFGGAVQYVLANVTVGEVLAGQGVKSGDTVKLELGPMTLGDDIDSVAKGIIGTEAILFLRLKGDPIPMFGVEGDQAEAHEGYYRLVNSQGLFVNDGGTVFLGLLPDSDGKTFPEELEGQSFEAAVDMTRQVGSN